MNMIDCAIHHISKKTHSERELRSVLEDQYNALPDLKKALNETFDYLTQHALIHDARLAQDIARHYAHKGNQFIRNTLTQRKITPEQINKALAMIPDEISRAWEETQKKLSTVQKQTNSKHEQINLLARFLSGRQFSYQVINEVINKLNTNTVYKLKDVSKQYWSKAS